MLGFLVSTVAIVVGMYDFDTLKVWTLLLTKISFVVGRGRGGVAVPVMA